MLYSNYQDFNTVMDDLGLFIDEKTGGFYDESFSGRVELNDNLKTERFEIIHPDNKVISFFSGTIFLKSLFDTEESFKIKLFV